EMNVKQPTVTDSLQALATRGFVDHEPATRDRRKHLWTLTPDGARIAAEAARGDHAGRDAIAQLDDTQQAATWQALLQIIAGFVQVGAISVARTCLTCTFHQQGTSGQDHCSLLQMDLAPLDLRLDCPEHVAADTTTGHHPDSGVSHAG